MWNVNGFSKINNGGYNDERKDIKSITKLF